MNSYDVLVLILATALAVFLLLAIVLIVYFIRIARYLEDIVRKADEVMDNAKTVGRVFERSAAPVAIAKLLASVVEAFTNRKKER